MEFEPGSFRNEYETIEGRSLWELLMRPETMARMRNLSDQGIPALQVLDRELVASHKQAVLIEEGLRRNRFKQMAGSQACTVMVALGYRKRHNPRAVCSPYFVTCERYERA